VSVDPARKEFVMHRAAVLTTVAIAGAIAVPATASSAPGSASGCAHLLVDPRGNAREWFLPGSPYNADADLLYVDARTTGSLLILTVGLAKVEAKPATGTLISVYFTTHHQGATGDYSADIDHQVDGDSYSVQNSDTLSVAPASGSNNVTAGTFTIQVPLKTIDSNYRGAVLSDLGVVVSQDVGVTEANGGFIEQSTGPEYRYVTGNANNCSRH
jgi:hypothetical protein